MKTNRIPSQEELNRSDQSVSILRVLENLVLAVALRHEVEDVKVSEHWVDSQMLDDDVELYVEEAVNRHVFLPVLISHGARLYDLCGFEWDFPFALAEHERSLLGYKVEVVSGCQRNALFAAILAVCCALLTAIAAQGKGNARVLVI